jgi:hypothetical protein
MNNKSVFLHLTRKNRVLIVSHEKDFENAEIVLKRFHQEILICGWVGEMKDPDFKLGYLGNTHQMESLVYRLGLNEILFCPGHLKFEEIIRWIQKLKDYGIRFSFLSPNGAFVVSSHEKNTKGKIVQFENIPELLRPYHLRQKRGMDLLICMVLVLLSPLIALKVKSFHSFLRNFSLVLFGKKTWIGLSTSSYRDFGLKDGIISMKDLAGTGATEPLILSLNNLYLNEFHPEHELWTVLKNIKFLGN